ncbi:hypothetical protein [Amycolatopsis sp. WAC 01375]|uniref:hypothetical protein n=1 Tax=Amycolatopsis sp. WAC 01375 TaxID=2203194 RepID=UPI00131555B9|nr:hypothetical protein [Amycolatopsis sp. WAC 01375]
MSEWMDQLTQAATRLAAERYRDIAFLRSTAAAGATDPVVRTRLEREAAEATAAAEGYDAKAAEMADDNEPWEEQEIQRLVDQTRVAATHDVLDDVGETAGQLRQREIADATMRSYQAWQQDGVPAEEIAQRLERVSPIGAKAVRDYEQLITIGYEPDDARAIAADTAAQDPIPTDAAVVEDAAAEHAVAHDTGEESTVDTNEPGISAQAEAAAVRRRNDEELYQSQVEQRYQALIRDGVDMVTALRRAEDEAAQNWQVEPWSAVMPRGTRPVADTATAEVPDQLAQAGTRLAAERYRHVASLRSTAAASATDPEVRARLEREAAEATATADSHDAKAAEMAAGNEPGEEQEIQRLVDQTHVATPHDVLDEAAEIEAPEVPEQAPEPGGWIERNLPAQDAGVTTSLPDMDLRTALELVTEDSRIESGDEGLTAREAAAMARELDVEDIHGVVESAATRTAYRTVLNAADADVDQALAQLSTAPSDDGQANEWPVVDQDDTSQVTNDADDVVDRIDQVLDEDVLPVSDREEMERARDAVRSLPDGPITDEDLARAGVTPEQYDRLMIEERAPEVDRAPEAGSWIDRNLPAPAAEYPEDSTYERDEGDRLQDLIEAREDELEADERDATEYVLDSIDEVLAEERGYALVEERSGRENTNDDVDESPAADSEAAPLAERMAECEQAVDDVVESVESVESVEDVADEYDEDEDRAERCAHWNSEDEDVEDDDLDDYIAEGW